MFDLVVVPGSLAYEPLFSLNQTSSASPLLLRVGSPAARLSAPRILSQLGGADVT